MTTGSSLSAVEENAEGLTPHKGAWRNAKLRHVISRSRDGDSFAARPVVWQALCPLRHDVVGWKGESEPKRAGAF
jgi:hypothetical protein